MVRIDAESVQLPSKISLKESLKLSIVRASTTENIAAFSQFLTKSIGIASGIDLASYLAIISVDHPLKSMHLNHFLEVQDFEKKPKYVLGNHGSIELSRATEERRLEDGVIIQKGDVIGTISIIRNIREMPRDAKSATEELLVDLCQGFLNFIDMYESEKMPQDIKALTGISHLAGIKINETNIPQLLGFELTPVNKVKKIAAALIGFRYRKNKFSLLKSFMNKLDRVKRVTISTQNIFSHKSLYEEIIERYGK